MTSLPLPPVCLRLLLYSVVKVLTIVPFPSDLFSSAALFFSEFINTITGLGLGDQVTQTDRIITPRIAMSMSTTCLKASISPDKAKIGVWNM